MVLVVSVITRVGLGEFGVSVCTEGLGHETSHVELDAPSSKSQRPRERERERELNAPAGEYEYEYEQFIFLSLFILTVLTFGHRPIESRTC